MKKVSDELIIWNKELILLVNWESFESYAGSINRFELLRINDDY